MKAAVCTKYGGPNTVKIREIAKPVPKDNEILVKIMATTVVPGDCKIRSFAVPPLFWLMGRLALGLTRPKNAIFGFELAGEVESVGKDVTRFKVGDPVFGSTFSLGFGAHAEYKCMPEDGIVALKPSNLSYQEAAGTVLAGYSVLWFLKEGDIQEGKKVLICGASGSLGTCAVQIAKYYGAQVTGVCSAGNGELVKSLGADKVIDYTKNEFTKNGETYDIIFDTVERYPFSRCKNSLAEDGAYLGSVLVPIQAKFQSMMSGKRIVGGTAVESSENLAFLKELLEAGKLNPIIDRSFPLEEIVEAHRYVDTGHKKGNVIITVGA